GGTRFSGAGREDRATAGPGTHWDRRSYEPPPAGKEADWMPARDWGRVTGPWFLLSYGGDYRFLVGGALNTTGHRLPHAPLPHHPGLRLPQGSLVRETEPSPRLLARRDGLSRLVPRPVPLRELAVPVGNRRARLGYRGLALFRQRQRDDARR